MHIFLKQTFLIVPIIHAGLAINADNNKKR